MVKQSRKRLRIKKRKSNRRITKKMMGGGNFTDIQKNKLLELGFSLKDIDILANIPVGIDIIEMSLQEINPITKKKNTHSDIMASIEKMRNEINNIDVRDNESFSNNNELDTRNNESFSNSSFNDIDNDEMPMLNISDLELNDEKMSGGKKRKTNKKRKTLKRGKRTRMRSRKQRGGMCFGTGVGANNYDPNFSIYNTRELSLFPYRPTN